MVLKVLAVLTTALAIVLALALLLANSADRANTQSGAIRDTTVLKVNKLLPPGRNHGILGNNI